MNQGRPAAPGLVAPGQSLGGKYEIVRLLGEGGMAYVFEARHRRLAQRVAIKVLAPDFARDAELVMRFEREARAVAKLRTPHVVRVTDVDVTADGVPYIVMEFLEGRDLDHELAARHRLPLDESVEIVLQTCAAMAEAHATGIVHRDLKPANLFLTTDGPERVVKVLDFGISKVIGESTRLTEAGTVMGTVLYMSPEQVKASSNVDTRADIWSLGVILFELLAGRVPWSGSSTQIAASIVSRDAPNLATVTSVPDPVAALVTRMLARDPARRPATVREVASALAPYARDGSLGANVARQLGASASGARPAAPNGLSKHTVPLVPTGPPSRRNLPTPTPAPAPAPIATEPLGVRPQAPSSPRAPAVTAAPRSRAVLVAAILLGLLGAVGVVLIVLAKTTKPRPPAVRGSDATATREPAPSVVASAPVLPSAASASASAPSAPSAAPKRASAAPSRAPSPPATSSPRTTPSTNPKLL